MVSVNFLMPGTDCVLSLFKCIWCLPIFYGGGGMGECVSKFLFLTNVTLLGVFQICITLHFFIPITFFTYLFFFQSEGIPSTWRYTIIIFQLWTLFGQSYSNKMSLSSSVEILPILQYPNVIWLLGWKKTSPFSVLHSTLYSMAAHRKGFFGL